MESATNSITSLPNYLILNGLVVDKKAVTAYNDNPSFISTSEKSLMNFLLNWFSDDETLVMKTSGSTGTPKVITASKKAMVESAKRTIAAFGLQKGMNALLCLSTDYIAGQMMVVRAMVSGMNLITSDIEANPIKNLNQPIDFAAMVPLQMMKAMQESPEKLFLIRAVLLGGSGISKALEEQLSGVSTEVYHSYGMTETLSHIALRKVNGLDATNWFSPLPDVSVELDVNSCLVITAPYISLIPFFTRDIGEINDKGQFRIKGRIDDVIISAGNKIHPEELEKLISSFVESEFIISSLDDDQAGQMIVLVLQAKFNTLNLYSLWEKLTFALRPHELPRRVVSLPNLPYLESGKINRIRVRELIAEMADA
ncbi:MAG: O-succinylbenzoic acid--CoA ligase [Bacteroidetes bacterium]|nr:MAG: O-succinylbenzoic acid--CoA ligase [Bacteroidota bacterium]